MTYYYNAAAQRFDLPERPLEPPGCWGEEAAEPDEEDYDRWEEEERGKRQRRHGLPAGGR